MDIITEIKTKQNTKELNTIQKTSIDSSHKVPDLSYFEDDVNVEYDGREFFESAIESIKIPKIGYVYEGIYVGEDSTHFLLDANLKDLIRVPKSAEESNFLSHADTNNITQVIITRIIDDKNYSIEGSVSYIYREEAFEMLNRMQDDQYVNVRIDKLTGAGYNCTLHMNGCDVKSFLPQILAGVNKIQDDEKEDLVGKELEMCVESYAPDKGTWIVSRRKYLKQLIPAYIDNLDEDIKYNGIVTGTAKFGVFVEFNDCLTGMIHRSNLTNDLKENFNDIKQGDEISFNVKEIIKGNRIILTQIETSSIWDSISIGQTFIGIIKEHKPFGTLIILDHETLGLIHSSEQTDDVKKMNSGEKIEVKVLAINKLDRKIYLKNI